MNPLPATPPARSFFFFNDTATTEIYTLSLHDALPISFYPESGGQPSDRGALGGIPVLDVVDEGDRLAHLLDRQQERDRKSTRLNSSHGYISYAVFCLKKKNTTCRVETPKLKTAPNSTT